MTGMTAGDPQAATSRKSERLLNLLIMLLVQRHYVSKERIREILYADSSRDAFEKMFERDKEELRSLGVPIEVGSIDPLFDDEPGYRVKPDEFALPDIRLTADEAAVVGLATRVWEHARLAEATTDAVRKLTAAGLEVDVSALDIVEPRLSADEPAFDVFWDATQQRQEVEFEYQRPGHPERDRPLLRHLQPWGVVRHAGRWYVVGLDTDRDEERVFRLSRVVGDARRVGAAASYDIPDGVDLRETTRRLAPPPSVVEATLLRAQGRGRDAAPGRRERRGRRARARHATARGTGWRSGGTGWPRRSSRSVADVVVESPAEPARRDRVAAAGDRGGGVDARASRKSAASGAKDQVARLLTLVPYLHSHPQVRLDETAAAVGSTPEQVVKDLGVLFMCGLPGGFPDDLIDVDLEALEDPDGGGPRPEGLIRVSNADYLARPLRLSPTEASAIIVALRALRGSAGEETREVVDRALAKLEAAAAAQTGGTPLVEPGDDDDAALARLRVSLEGAVARRRQVRLTYYVPARDEESERVVDPRGVVTAAGVAYLDAWCHSAEAPRLFRLDRIHEATVLDSPVETAPEPPARPLRRAVPALPGDHPGHPVAAAPGALGRGVLPGGGGPARPRTAGSRWTCWSRTSGGCGGC